MGARGAERAGAVTVLRARRRARRAAAGEDLEPDEIRLHTRLGEAVRDVDACQVFGCGLRPPGDECLAIFALRRRVALHLDRHPRVVLKHTSNLLKHIFALLRQLSAARLELDVLLECISELHLCLDLGFPQLALVLRLDFELGGIRHGHRHDGGRLGLNRR